MEKDIKCICKYCGHDWIPWSYERIDEVTCPRCGDKDIKLVDTSTRNVFGY